MATAKAHVAKIPSLIYGTAWKKNQTRALVNQAILAGFRGVDTAAQPKHYQEDLVGEGIRDALAEGGISRQDLYIQTKFTSIHGQDPRNHPYNPDKSITCQVGTSIASSLKHLRHTDKGPFVGPSQPYIDCLVLHSPFPSPADTKEAWRAMELHVPQSVRTLGISNIYQIEALQTLYDFASVKPSVVQNRFYPASGYDVAIRAFCAEKGIRYQSFWTLTGNPHLLKAGSVAATAAKANVSKPVALYGLVLGLGNVSVLNGTTSAEHMDDDLMGVERVVGFMKASPEVWQSLQQDFQAELQASSA